ncbi:hypothetical protein [Saccharothrix coeruleofusca]|uniref:hypothetical protein n=1 Tax=Saccharothrix coeruleofusca TaxID=33919 RepID=UPI001670B37D|nr:hypothetical protein [Saccharothrix coeruleofusca]
MLRGLALAALLLAACTAAPEPAPRPPRWTKVATDLPEDVTVTHVAGWDGGLVAAAGFDQPVAFASDNGERWWPAAPDGLTQVIGVAGHGGNGYLLGLRAGGAAVWRTDDGRRWESTPLEGAFPEDTALAVAAGPRGVVVAGYGPWDATSSSRQDVRTWHSRDGREFDRTSVLELGELDGLMPPQLTATSDGFLLQDVWGLDTPFLHGSRNGLDWHDLSQGLPKGALVVAAGAGGTTVALTREGDPALAVELGAWYRRAGENWRSGSIDLGELPDVGALPRSQQEARDVRPWGDGFIAVGSAMDAYAGTGAVWISADGVTWRKEPVRDNGFDTASEFTAIAATAGSVFLFGTRRSDDAGVVLWRAPAPPVTPTTTTTPHGPPTRVVDFALTGQELHSTEQGRCAAPSRITARDDAWSCRVMESDFDPCFSSPDEPGRAFCPTGQDNGLAVELTAPLPARTPAPPDAPRRPWLLELATGEVCTATTHEGYQPVDGLALSMICADGGAGGYVWGEVDTSGSTWIARFSHDEHGPAEPTAVITAYR